MKWLKKLLGVDALQDRLKRLEDGRADLEIRVIEAEKVMDIARKSVLFEKFDEEVAASLDFPLAQLSEKRRTSHVNPITLAREYRIEPYIARESEPHPSAVISISDLQEHPEKYLHKIKKGFLAFPIGFDLGTFNQFFGEKLRNCSINEDGTFYFAYNALAKDYCFDGKGTSIIQALREGDINQSQAEGWIKLSPLDFIANYDKILALVKETGDLSLDQQRHFEGIFSIARGIYYSAFELVGKTTICDSHELLGESIPSQNSEIVSASPLEQSLYDALLLQPKGTSYEEIQRLLSIKSRPRFSRLAAQRTQELLHHDKFKKGLTSVIGKKLEDYSVGESVALACYFARNFIQEYQNIDGAVESVLGNLGDEKIKGKCTDYTGLALHYLQQYLIPLNSEKFKNWRFGYDADNIGSYKHCYMKIIRINLDYSTDVFFLDPTVLSNGDVSQFKTPKGVIAYANANHLPIEIVRDAEDFLSKPLEDES